MKSALNDSAALKELLKSAIVEVLEERGDLIQKRVAEALEDIGLANAIAQGESTDDVSRDEIFGILAQGSGS